MDYIYPVLCGMAILVMVFAWIRITRLRKKIPGGIVKSSANLLAELIGLLTVGYLTLPFFPMLPQISKDIVVGVIILFTAIFVVIVINLFHMIASEAGF
jgi:hypothetical protein